MNIARSVTTVALALAMASCISVGTRGGGSNRAKQEILSVGYWFSLVGSEVTFYADGHARWRMDANRVRTELLSPHELQLLRELLASHEFGDFAASLKNSGYKPGCCDVKEVVFTLHEETFGYPVCESETVADLRYVVGVLNSILKNHFRGRFTIPAGDCQ